MGVRLQKDGVPLQFPVPPPPRHLSFLVSPTTPVGITSPATSSLEILYAKWLLELCFQYQSSLKCILSFRFKFFKRNRVQDYSRFLLFSPTIVSSQPFNQMTIFFFFFWWQLFFFFLTFERQSVGQAREGQREKRTEKIPSRLRAVSAELNSGSISQSVR